MTTHLTPRQLDVLRLSMEGWSNAEIADRLFIQERTVRSCRHEIRRMGVPLPHYRKPVPDPDTVRCLSPRESQVCRLARAGLKDREIAERLGGISGVSNVLYRARQKAADKQMEAAS